MDLRARGVRSREDGEGDAVAYVPFLARTDLCGRLWGFAHTLQIPRLPLSAILDEAELGSGMFMAQSGQQLLDGSKLEAVDWFRGVILCGFH